MCETFSATFSTRATDLLGRDDIGVASPTLTIVVGYPFAGRHAVVVEARTAGGFTRGALFEELVRIYAAMYEGVDSPRLETAWHRLEDLAIEGVMVDPARAIAWVQIGS